MGEIKTNKNCTVVDLPGIYSLRPFSSEEIDTRDFILNEKPDVIINIIDATNIERNLYLTLQLLEMEIPMVLALNMMDEVRNNGGTIDVKKMSEKLGIPVVPISAAKNEGVDELVKTSIYAAKGCHRANKKSIYAAKGCHRANKNKHLYNKKKIYPKIIDFCDSGPVHRCIHAVSHMIEDYAENAGVSARFAATMLIEGDESIIKRLKIDENELITTEHCIIVMEAEHMMDRNSALADMRYTFIEKVCAETVTKIPESKEHIRSVRIDRVFTNKYLAIPLFIGIMLAVFWLTFGVIGTFLSDMLAMAISELTVFVESGLEAYGINRVVHSLIIDGIFAGVGSVLSFLPIIVTLFFFLSILEDTGYMARVAFVMDKLLRKIGLSGRSFVPMLIGFGCTVPAIMATRTLPSERDRKRTILLTPFMSCSAKIPIYAVFTAAFFTEYQALVMISLYVTGIIFGILTAVIINKTGSKGKPVPFVMELPNYRLPSFKSVVLLMWERARDFLQRAFTVIFVATIVIWFLQSFDPKLNVVTDPADSLLAIIGKTLSPLFVPLGFGDWRVSTSLIAGISAKEAVISTLSVLTATSVDKLSATLGSLFTPLSAISFLVFTLLYTTCIAAVTAMKRELKSAAKALLIVIMQCVIAYVASLVIYQTGSAIF